MITNAEYAERLRYEAEALEAEAKYKRDLAERLEQ